jgi:hypothetical protein
LSTPAVHRRGLLLVGVATVVLVLLRTYIFLRYGPAFFDSDQAVVGLMAKHLSEGRGFPLFFYGQNYLLGVEAWMAAPLFVLGGPTVAMLRLPLVLLNLATGGALILVFVRRGLPPWLAGVVVLPFLVTTPIVSAELVTALGASVEPFLYVVLLWALRRRPWAFGMFFAFACLHREFCLFALPAMVVAVWLEGRPWSRPNWLAAFAGAAAVWGLVDWLKWHVNTLGVTGGVREVSSLAEEARTIGAFLSFDPSGYLARLGQVVTSAPELVGGRPYSLQTWALDDALTAGSAVAGLALGLALAVALGRLIVLLRQGRGGPGVRRARAAVLAWPAYLAIIAALTVAAYGLNGGIDPHAAVVTRYLLFVLLFPVAVVGAWALVDQGRLWRASIVALLLVWAGATAADAVRWTQKLRAAPPDSEFRYLAADLMAHGVRYGRAQYWDAYIVTFFARERVVLASTDKVRIGAYQSEVDAHAGEAAGIRRVPCEGGRRVASWCVDEPPHSP